MFVRSNSLYLQRYQQAPGSAPLEEEPPLLTLELPQEVPVTATERVGVTTTGEEGQEGIQIPGLDGVPAPAVRLIGEAGLRLTPVVRGMKSSLDLLVSSN